MNELFRRVLVELAANNSATMEAYMDGEKVCTITQVSDKSCVKYSDCAVQSLMQATRTSTCVSQHPVSLLPCLKVLLPVLQYSTALSVNVSYLLPTFPFFSHFPVCHFEHFEHFGKRTSPIFVDSVLVLQAVSKTVY